MMRKNLIWLAVAAGLFAACKQTPKEAPAEALNSGLAPNAGGNSTEITGEEMKIRGLLAKFPDKIGFMDYKSLKVYIINDLTKSIEADYQKIIAPTILPGETVFASLTGRISGIGQMKVPIFDVQKVDTLSAKSPELLTSLGIPWEFWCHGTEPFWDIEICNFEGAILFQNASDGTAIFLPWVPPVKDANGYTYNIPASPGANPAMTIKIKKGKATDGMSEIEYEYSAEVTVNGSKLKGVAVRGPGPLEGPSK